MEAKRRTCFRKNGVVSCVLCLSEVTVSRSDDWFWEMDFTGHFIRHGLKALVGHKPHGSGLMKEWVVIVITEFCSEDQGFKHIVCLVAQLILTRCHPMDCSLPSTAVHGDSPCRNTGVGCHALLQGIFPTQELQPGLHIVGRFFTI